MSDEWRMNRNDWFNMPIEPKISIEDQRYMELSDKTERLADEIKKLTLQNMRLNEIIQYIYMIQDVHIRRLRLPLIQQIN